MPPSRRLTGRIRRKGAAGGGPEETLRAPCVIRGAHAMAIVAMFAVEAPGSAFHATVFPGGLMFRGAVLTLTVALPLLEAARLVSSAARDVLRAASLV